MQGDVKLTDPASDEAQEYVASFCESLECAGVAVPPLSIGVISKRAASLADNGDAEYARDASIRLPGLAVFFVAPLSRQVVSSGVIQWSDPLGLLLDMPALSSVPGLSGTTFKQLLENPHWPDDSRVDQVKLDTRGFLELQGPLAALASGEPFGNHGILYSRGRCGVVFAAAALEHRLGQSYPNLLRQRLFSPLEITPLIDIVADYAGGWQPFQVQVDTSALLRVIGAQFGPGACPGWRSLGSDWYGEDISCSAGALCIRFNPRMELGLLIRSECGIPTSSAEDALARMLPEYGTGLASAGGTFDQVLDDLELNLDLAGVLGRC